MQPNTNLQSENFELKENYNPELYTPFYSHAAFH